MKKILYLFVILLNFTILYSQNPEWIKINNERVFSFEEGTDSYYIGYLSGIDILNKLTGDIINLWTEEHRHRIYDMLYENNKLWVGTNWGLRKFENNKWFTFGRNNTGLSQSIILNITVDNNGHVWTSNMGGLSRFDGDKAVSFNNDTSFHPSWIFNLVCDNYNQIWLLSLGNYIDTIIH